MSDSYPHGVRYVWHPARYPLLRVVEEPRHHRLGDARDLSFGREDRLGDSSEDLYAIFGFPLVELVPDVFVDGLTEFFELGEGSGGGICEGRC